MNFDEVEKIIEKAKKQPQKVALIGVVLIALSIAMLYLSTFISKKAEQHASMQASEKKLNPQKGGSKKQPNGPLMLPPDYSVPPNPKKWGLIICIENYLQLPKVEYARKDGFTLRDYFTRILGIPKENIVSLIDSEATLATIEGFIKTYFPKNLSKDSTLFVYFSGHGMPGIKRVEPYLVPYDADTRLVEQTCYNLNSFYQDLYGLDLERVYVFIDACFNGVASRAAEMHIKDERPVLVQPQPDLVQAKNNKLHHSSIISLNATSSGETSNAYPEKEHGLFTYYLLRGIKGDADIDRDGWTSMKEIYTYVHHHVLRESRRMQGAQTPSILPPIQQWEDFPVCRSLQ